EYALVGKDVVAEVAAKNLSQVGFGLLACGAKECAVECAQAAGSEVVQPAVEEAAVKLDVARADAVYRVAQHALAEDQAVDGGGAVGRFAPGEADGRRHVRAFDAVIVQFV